MSKQIKLGFDRGSPSTRITDQPLVDVRGNFLRDQYGDFLFTETDVIPPESFFARNSTSVNLNNESDNRLLGGPISVREQFPEQSEVSISMLGVPRAERQQTLLSDVSIYGMDDNTWEFYRSPNPLQPNEWATRTNRTYGRRFNPRLKEHPNEQALALEVFPTPWNFPFGPNWGSQRRFNSILFPRYINFILLGNALYEYYASRNLEVFASENFLVPDMAVFDGEDIIYNENFDLALQYIEQWTMTWMNIRDNILEDPLNVGFRLSAGAVNRILKSSLGFDFSQTQPGYSSTSYRYCQLQSKESYRYQPGAISGFTFGVKLNADPASLATTLEWGCANETDQLMFQVRGSQFNIVRRSTVPLTQRNLELNGFSLEDQETIESPNPFERSTTTFTTSDIGVAPPVKPQLYELVITNSKFNVDPLDGTGPSRYNISFNEVTMYKIEYSWYGAIGAKFYVYAPSENAGARWILVHQLIIENTLDFPSLQNPFMHFRYAIYSNDTSTLREPVYLFKYGASYYIDGSDEGTFTYNSYRIPSENSITSTNSTPLMSFIPKDRIFNRDGVGILNRKNFYIENISVTSSKNARLDLLECDGCPGGHGYFYAPGLVNGQRGIEDRFRINSSGNLEFVDPEKEFDEFEGNKKIIGPGIFSSYAFPKEDDNQTLTIRRRFGIEIINTPIDNKGYESGDAAIVGGNEIDMIGYEFDGRITGFDDIIASDVPLNKKNIKIMFLNPTNIETTGQWAEFRIGITNKKPALELSQDGTEELLLFGGSELDMDSEIFGEFHQFQTEKNVQGIDIGELDPRYGDIMQQDPRIGSPTGTNSGKCSELNFELNDLILNEVSYSTTDPSNQLEGGNYIIFKRIPPVFELDGGGIGIFNGNRFVESGVKFTSNVVEFFNEDDDENNYIVSIDSDISLLSDISEENIAIKTVRCFGRFINITKTFPYAANEYYLFVAMRDNARIHNIVVKEFDDQSSFSHTPNWLSDDRSNINVIQVQNRAPGGNVVEKLETSNEFIDNDGNFYMGGITFTGNSPSNFIDRNRQDSILFDDQISLPLRPSSLLTSIFLSGNKTESINMNHIYDQQKLKMTKGSFNNRYLTFSSIIIEPQESGTIQLNISGKEQ
jgi:hypothetical protein